MKVLTLEETAENISDLVERRSLSNGRWLVLLSGQGGVGKTTLSELVSRRLSYLEYTSIDGYLPSRKERKGQGEGDLQADFSSAKLDIEAFLSGKQIATRRYDHTTGTPYLADYETSISTKVLIVEGGLVGRYFAYAAAKLRIVFLANPKTYYKLRRQVDLSRGYDEDQFRRNFEYYDAAWRKHAGFLINNADLVLENDGSFLISIL